MTQDKDLELVLSAISRQRARQARIEERRRAGELVHDRILAEEGVRVPAGISEAARS